MTEFISLVEAVLGELLDERTAYELSRIQAQLHARGDELTSLLDSGAMNPETYLGQHTEALRDAMKASETLLGRDRFLAIFGEAGDHPKGLFDRAAFLAQESDNRPPR